VSALITREPKQDLKVTKNWLLRLKVRFGLVSVTVSNAEHAKKCVGNFYTYFDANSKDYGLRDYFRPTRVKNN
jgi:hypothetical protein